MAVNTFKWAQKFTSFGLFSAAAEVANNEISAESAEFTNATGFELYGVVEFVCNYTVAPSDTHPTIDIYLRPELIAYVDPPLTGGPQQQHMLAASMPVKKVTGPQRILSPSFVILPLNHTFYMDNQSGQPLPTGWSANLYYGSLATHTP